MIACEYPFEGEIESLIFDFDGVIVDSDELHWKAYREAFASFGVSFSMQDYCDRAKGRGRSEVVELFGAELSARDRKRVAEEKGAAAERLLHLGALKPVAGVVDFIRSARNRGLPCAVASTSELAGLAVDVLGMSELFDCVYARTQRDRPKPHPDVFLRALESLKMPADGCLVIEDTDVGVRAARAAGTQVILRRVETASVGQALPRDVIGFFDDYARLHAGLGWGKLVENSA